MPHFTDQDVITADGLNNAAHKGFERIDSKVLGSSSTNVVFSSISQNFLNLYLVLTTGKTGTGEDALRIRFNDDTSSSYDKFTFQIVNDGTVNAFRQRNAANAQIGWIGSTHSVLHETELIIHGYSRTDRHKIITGNFDEEPTSDTNNEVRWTWLYARWQSDSAITKIEIFPDTDGLQAGSIFHLFGLGT